MNTTNDTIDAMTEAVYYGLFGFDTARANEWLGLPAGTDEETCRDHMGIWALQALSDVERKAAKRLHQQQCKIEFTVAYALVLGIALREWQTKWREVARTGSSMLIGGGGGGQ